MIAASNQRQHERLFHALGRPDLAAQSGHEERERLYEQQTAALGRIIAERTADDWKQSLQSRHVPAGRARTLSEALADPQIKGRRLLPEHAGIEGTEGPTTVPMAAFKFAHGGPSIETPPPRLGEHTEEVRSLGYTGPEIAALRAEGAI